MLDLLIKGGRVIDPANRINEIKTIGVQNGLIVEADENAEASQVLDAAGYTVAPGLIDGHAHIWPLTNMGVQAESACFPSGVTTAVDAGSTGCATYECHRPAMLGMQVNVKALLHVCPAGLTAFRTKVEYIDPALFDKASMHRLIRQYSGEIVGVKIRMGQETALDMGTAPLLAACDIAHEAGLPVVVHSTRPPVSMRELIECLGPGDIITHPYHGHGRTILEDGGMDALQKARERGVYIDVGDAGWHISFEVMRKALEAGLAPDSISTDITDRGCYRRGSTFSLLHCMSKWRTLGLSMEDVIRCVTQAPAQELHLNAGTLSTGAVADIAILREEPTSLVFTDGVGQQMEAGNILRAMATIRAGRLVYRDTAF